MGCATAAIVNSTAIDALNGGCRIQCPVNSVPGGERNAITVMYTPYAIAAQPATTQAPATRRGAYGTSMPSLDNTADGKPTIDPILQKVLDAVPFRLSTEDGVDALRQRFRDLPRRPVHPELRVEDRDIDGPAGSIGIRIYWPPTNPDHSAHRFRPPVVLYFHGGGFVTGDLDTRDGTCRQHAVGADAVVVSVDYRLAPEHPYPAAVEDAWAATLWFAEHGPEIGADATRMAVAGDSAGGNIAAVIAQQTRDNGDWEGAPLAFQLLWYPSTMWDSSLPSFTENATALILDTKALADFSRWYAGEIDMSNPPPAMAPGRAQNLADLAPAYIGVAGHDPLRDDGIRYGELLAAAGVPVEVHNAETLVHGYVGYAGVVPAATAALDSGLAALRAALYG
jgi:acetyl esterase